MTTATATKTKKDLIEVTVGYEFKKVSGKTIKQVLNDAGYKCSYNSGEKSIGVMVESAEAIDSVADLLGAYNVVISGSVSEKY